MTESMGEIIRRLRRERDLTQEELAEQLGVTSQAVSKWENNTGMPDISQIVPLANLFCVSTDTLFNYCSAERTQELASYRERSLRLRNEGRIEENVALWREAVQKFPGDYGCMTELASALENTTYCDEFSETHESAAKEAVRLCERILADCTDHSFREEAIQLLVYLYSNQNLSIANGEKAVAYAKQAGCIWHSSEFLLEAAYFDDEEAQLKQMESNLLDFLDTIAQKLSLCLPCANSEERIRNCLAALTLWETVIPDGNYQFYHCRIAEIYRKLANCYAHLTQKEPTLDALEHAAFHARAFDERPNGEQHYTSPFLPHATSNRSESVKNYPESDYTLFLERLQDDCFDFVQSDERFQALLR